MYYLNNYVDLNEENVLIKLKEILYLVYIIMLKIFRRRYSYENYCMKVKVVKMLFYLLVFIENI